MLRCILGAYCSNALAAARRSAAIISLRINAVPVDPGPFDGYYPFDCINEFINQPATLSWEDGVTGEGCGLQRVSPRD